MLILCQHRWLVCLENFRLRVQSVCSFSRSPITQPLQSACSDVRAVVGYSVWQWPIRTNTLRSEGPSWTPIIDKSTAPFSQIHSVHRCQPAVELRSPQGLQRKQSVHQEESSQAIRWLHINTHDQPGHRHSERDTHKTQGQTQCSAETASSRELMLW